MTIERRFRRHSRVASILRARILACFVPLASSADASLERDATHRGRYEQPPDVLPASLDTLQVFESAPEGPLTRVVGGALLDREVVVAEASTGSLHYFDRATGVVRRRVGRIGSGPGEFRRLDWLAVRGSTFFTWDTELRRLSVWTSAGQLQGTVALSAANGTAVPEPVSVFANGDLLARSVIPEDGVSSSGVLLPRTASVMAPRYRLSRHSPDGRLVNTLGAYRGTESFVAPNAGGGATSGRALFGRHGAAVASGDAIVVLSSEHDSVLRVAADGRRLGHLRVPRSAPVAVRRADVARARALAVPPGRLPFNIGEVFDQQKPPTSFPRFGWGGSVRLPALTSTSDGSVWLLHYGGVRSREARYLRFSSRGELIDTLQFGDEARVLDARDDVLLVATTDEYGIERVLLLKRSARR